VAKGVPMILEGEWRGTSGNGNVMTAVDGSGSF
jgi:hypothetical protein